MQHNIHFIALLCHKINPWVVKLREQTGVPVMFIRPSNKKGEIVIRTKFGDVAADNQNFSMPVEELMKDEGWQKEIGLKGGPFCYMESELDIPF